MPPYNPRSRDDHYHWHAGSHGGGFDEGSRPLLDASILISAVWRYRYLIGAATVAGAVLGVVMALATPHKYYAESRLFVDPREIRVTEDDVRNQQLSTEAVLAITDSQLQILSSTSVLEKVITDLGLDRDPEFNGALASGGIRAGWQQIKQIFSGKGGPSEKEQKALNHLRDAVSVARDAKTFVIIIGVKTLDPDKSALIVNQIVETYLDSEGQAQSSLLERTSESIDTRINSLRTELDLAEREVERFKAENGLVGVGGQYIDDKVILALSDQLANARAMKVGIRIKADDLAKVNINDVLSGAFPEELLSSNLTELRKQYTQTKSTAEALATRLGPRHPQYIAALSSLETITQEISAELRRIVASSQTELQRAVEIEQELASQMAVAKSRAVDQSVDFVTLRELERKAAATRGIYEAFLTRSRETSERSNLSTRNVRVISPAEAPLQPMGPSRKFIAVGGMAGGFFAAVGLALLAGAVESFTAYNNGPPQARFQTPPFGRYPGPQDPAPRTPPSGPGRQSWTGRDDDPSDLDAAADEATAEAFHGARAQAGAPRSQTRPADARPVRSRQETVETAAPPHPATGRTAEPRGEPVQRPSGPVTAPRYAAASFAEAFDPSAHQHNASRQPTAHLPDPGYGRPAYARSGYGDWGQAGIARSQAPSSQPYAAQAHLDAQARTFGAAPQAPRQMQPLWSAPTAQPQHPQQVQPLAHPHFQPPVQPHGQPQPPHHHADWIDSRQSQPVYPVSPAMQHYPYAAMQPGAHAGYAAAPAGPVAMAPVYPMPDPRLMPPLRGQPQFYPQPQLEPWTYPVQQFVSPPQMQAHYPSVSGQPTPYVQQQPAPAQTWTQSPPAEAMGAYPAVPQPHAASPLHQPEAPQAAAPQAQSAEPVRPANDAAVERIRRDMDGLRSRINGYGTQRRRA